MKMHWSLLGLLAGITGVVAAEISIAEIENNPALWPKEVLVNVPLQVPLQINGQSAGNLDLPAGRVLPVKSVANGQVTLTVGASTATVSPADTDLETRAARQRDARTQLAAAQPTPAFTPASRPPPTAQPLATPPPVSHPVAAQIQNELVEVKGRKLAPFDGKELAGKKYLAIYFSAEWCPPCRMFTPELVRWYRRMQSRNDQFELVFVSRDETEAAMVNYMTGDRMPWPALAFARASSSNPLSRFAGSGIPCLVVVDDSGKAVLDSYIDGKYVGPRKVLDEFEKLLKAGS